MNSQNKSENFANYVLSENLLCEVAVSGGSAAALTVFVVINAIVMLCHIVVN